MPELAMMNASILVSVFIAFLGTLFALSSFSLGSVFGFVIGVVGYHYSLTPEGKALQAVIKEEINHPREEKETESLNTERDSDAVNLAPKEIAPKRCADPGEYSISLTTRMVVQTQYEVRSVNFKDGGVEGNLIDDTLTFDEVLFFGKEKQSIKMNELIVSLVPELYEEKMWDIDFPIKIRSQHGKSIYKESPEIFIHFNSPMEKERWFYSLLRASVFHDPQSCKKFHTISTEFRDYLQGMISEIGNKTVKGYSVAEYLDAWNAEILEGDIIKSPKKRTSISSLAPKASISSLTKKISKKKIQVAKHSVVQEQEAIVEENEGSVRENVNNVNTALLLLNLVLGRMFWDLHRNEVSLNIIRLEIQEKFETLDLPPLMGPIKVTSLLPGRGTPVFEKLGKVTCDVDEGIGATFRASYEGGATMCLEFVVGPNQGKTKNASPLLAKAVEMVLETDKKIKISVQLLSLNGQAHFKLMPPPSNRLWLGFTKEADIDLAFSSQIEDTEVPDFAIKFIKQKLKDLLVECFVLPNSSDLEVPIMTCCFQDYSEYLGRKGENETLVTKIPKPQEVEPTPRINSPPSATSTESPSVPPTESLAVPSSV